MSRATVDLQGVRFFLGYGLIFFFQHIFTIIGVGLVIFLIDWRLALISLTIAPFLIAVRTSTAMSRIPSCATCRRRWPMSRPSRRRTSSACTS